MAPLGTRVARRVLGLFLLCALLPVAVTILGSYARVQSALVDQRVAQLGQAAEAFGTALLERFYLADQLARSVAASGAASHAIDERLARYFSSIVVLRPGAAPRVLLGDVSNLPAGTGVEPGGGAPLRRGRVGDPRASRRRRRPRRLAGPCDRTGGAAARAARGRAEPRLPVG